MVARVPQKKKGGVRRWKIVQLAGRIIRFNAWRGCQKVSDGCKFCYAEVDLSVKLHGIKWGPNGTRVKTSPAYWLKPFAWNRKAELEGKRPRVFIGSLMDWAEDWYGVILHHAGGVLRRCCQCRGLTAYMPSHCCHEITDVVLMSDLRRDMFSVIDQTPLNDYLLLTKRPENIRRWWIERYVRPDQIDELAADDDFVAAYRRLNVHLGTSVENNEQLKRVDELRKCRDLAPVLWLSLEPLLEAMPCLPLDGIDWVVVGAESGKNRRPFQWEWVRNIADQCTAAGVRVFVKQGSALKPGQQGDIPDELWRLKELPEVESNHARPACYDCGLVYGSQPWADIIVPDVVWRRISPTRDDGSLLCFNCINCRLAALGLRNVPFQITSGPFCFMPREETSVQ